MQMLRLNYDILISPKIIFMTHIICVCFCFFPLQLLKKNSESHQSCLHAPRDFETFV